MQSVAPMYVNRFFSIAWQFVIPNYYDHISSKLFITPIRQEEEDRNYYYFCKMYLYLIIKQSHTVKCQVDVKYLSLLSRSLFTRMDVDVCTYNFNSMINHYLRKTILIGGQLKINLIILKMSLCLSMFYF